MYKWLNGVWHGLLLASCMVGSAQVAAQSVGRTASAAEIAAWNIDVRPDFQGLPKGSGSVARGQQVWDAKCASCHGSFGESNQVFTPIVGGTTAQDVLRGRVAALANNKEPQRTSMMKLATLSTMWDYIRRAMPWNAPKSLSNDEVYAVTAYILNLAEVVPDNFVLSEQNIADVKLPNRLGMQQNHGLWLNHGKPDVQNSACMKDCGAPATITSRLPAHAANSHGDLAQQHRLIGAVRGQPSATPSAALNAPKTALQLTQQFNCTGCHALDQKVLGPTWRAIAARYAGQADAKTRLLSKLQQGGSGAWGEIPMPAQGHIPASDLASMVEWLLAGAK